MSAVWTAKASCTDLRKQISESPVGDPRIIIKVVFMRGFFTGFAAAIAVILILSFIGLLMYPDLIIIYHNISEFLGG